MHQRRRQQNAVETLVNTAADHPGMPFTVIIIGFPRIHPRKAAVDHSARFSSGSRGLVAYCRSWLWVCLAAGFRRTTWRAPEATSLEPASRAVHLLGHPQPNGYVNSPPIPLRTPRSTTTLRAEGPTERQKRRKRRYATFKHQGGYRNVSVKLP